MDILKNLGTALSQGALVMAIGLLVVFFALGLLIFMIWLLSKVIRTITGKADAKAKAKAAAKEAALMAAAPAAEPEPVVEESAADEIPGEVIAAISAAIAAFDNSGKSLVVRSVRKVGAWKSASRGEAVYRF